MKPRVFISSVIEGFEEFRKKAKEAVIEVGGDAFLIEEHPSLPQSSRTACLDGVQCSDIYVVILGTRGGWKAPSGKLVVEEEYEEACKYKLPILAFIQKIEHDELSLKLVKRISDYVDGVFRKTFSSAEDLKDSIKQALNPIVEANLIVKLDIRKIDEKLSNPIELRNETTIRFVLAPERDQEIVDSLSLESDEFKRKLLELGHSSKVDLFSYEASKTSQVGVNELVILQEDKGGREGNEDIRLEVTGNGIIIIDMNVTGRVQRGDLYTSISSMIILEEDLISCLHKCFSFADAFFQVKDEYKRHSSFLWNVSLNKIGYKSLRKKMPEGNSITMGMHRKEEVIAFDQHKMLSRAELKSPSQYIETAVSLFRRKLKS